MITREFAVDRLARRLDDPAYDVWSRSELEGFIQDGYDRLVRDTDAIFDMVGFGNEPSWSNYTADWEREYMTDLGIPIAPRPFNFSGEDERSFAGPGAVGPVNAVSPKDAQDTDDVGTPTAVEVFPLPERYTQIDRVLHDKLRLNPEHPRTFRQSRNTYETEQGGVFSYSVGQDGLFSLRAVGVPIPTVPTTTISGVYGGLRQVGTAQVADPEVVGAGVIRSYPGVFTSGRYGVIRRIVPPLDTTRVEMYRLGKPLTDEPFEIPDRFVKYVEFYGLARAYAKDGPGQDKALSEHYQSRFDLGKARMKRLAEAVDSERTIAMGGGAGAARRDTYLDHFPSTYGRKRPWRGTR